MNIILPPEIESRISREEAALHLAVGLYVVEKVTLGQAAGVAGLSQPRFLQELGRRQIPIHYGLDELEEDLATVSRIGRSGAG
jgi:predicted HTH domain antitoxin